VDEISLLYRARTDIPDRTPNEVARGRTALLNLVAAHAPVSSLAGAGSDTPYAVTPTRHRRRVTAWAGFSVLGAAALVMTLVVINLVGIPGWRVGADPAAASVLESAAAATLNFSDPVVAPGQFLLVKTQGVYLTQGSPKVDAESFHEKLYIPADRKDDWVWVRYASTPTQAPGSNSESPASETAQADSNQILRLAGGTTDNGNAFGWGYYDGTKVSSDYGALPRDPQQLLAKIHEFNGAAGPSPDGEALVWIADLLRNGTVPADLRAALYDAAAAIPGVTVTEEQATLDGRTGVAIGRDESVNNIRQDIIIDPSTGQFIGERQVVLSGNGDVPAGTVTASTTVTSTVVDAAP
jgi:RNA polymerase sigma-70 factor (ECF subfamily)